MSRRILTLFCAPVSLAVIAIAGACSSVEEQPPESQLFATDPFGLESGLAIVEMTHQGEGDFVVNLLSARQGEAAPVPGPIKFSGDQNGGDDIEAAFALAKETGSANISRAVHIPTAGEYVFDVKADGPWTIKVEQPRPSSAPKTTNFSGEGDAVTSFFELSNGSKQVTMSNPLETKLEISLLDKDGNAVGPALVDETDEAERSPSANISTTVNIDKDGIYLFDIQANGLWTIEVADVDEQTNSTEEGPSLVPSILLALLVNLAWILIFVVVIRLRGLQRKRST